MRLTIVGFGLIGGSIARALHERTTSGWRVTAWSRRPEPVRTALRDGVLHAAADSLPEALRGADLVVLAAPPLVCLDLLDRLAGPLRDSLAREATVTDVVSTKGMIVARADALRVPFVGGHPMAGREVTGYGSSLGDLFVDRPWVTVPGRCARLIDGERVGALIEACGAVQLPMTASDHDQAVAAISHLPLVTAVALVEAMVGRSGEPERHDWQAAEMLAATGWSGMTRLARGDAAMAAGIAATNATAIAARVRELRTVLDEWLRELERSEGPDAAALLARFEAARRRIDPGAK